MKRKTIILSTLVGIIALSVASVGITVAWYQASNILNVDNIVVQIEADRNLWFSTSYDKSWTREEVDAHFHSTLTDSDGELNVPSSYSPVSSMYSSSWMNNKAESPTYYDVLNVATSGYFSQDLYLYCNDSAYVTLDLDQTFIEFFNTAYARVLQKQHPELGLSEKEINDKLSRLVNAMRFAFVVPEDENNEYQYYILDPNSNESDVYLGGVLDNDSNTRGYYDFYIDPLTQRRYETVYGDYNNREYLVYDEPLDHDSELVESDKSASAFNAMHKKGVYRFNKEASIAKGLEFVRENKHTKAELAADKEQFMIYLDAYKPKKINVSLYIEGWDLDADNYTQGASFNANLSFKIDRLKVEEEY